MNIGSRLKEILEERSMNVSQLSREADVPAQTLYAMIKRDSNKADMDIMARILDALDMDLLEFLGQEPRKNKKKKRVNQSVATVVEKETKTEKTEKVPEPVAEERPRRRELEDYLL